MKRWRECNGSVLEQRAAVTEALAKHGYNLTRAADELGITYRGLLKKMKRLGMI